MPNRFLCAAFALAGLLAIPAFASAASVTIDGTPVADVVAKDGHLLVPFRAPMEEIGATVDWAAPVATASMNGSQLVQITIDSKTASILNSEHTLTVAPVLVNSLAYVPPELLADISHAHVAYSPDHMTATVTDFDLEGINDVGFTPITVWIWGWILVAAGVIAGLMGFIVKQQTA